MPVVARLYVKHSLDGVVTGQLCKFGPGNARFRFGVDLIAQAKSGTGKTCVFAVVALESLQPNAGGGQALEKHKLGCEGVVSRPTARET